MMAHGNNLIGSAGELAEMEEMMRYMHPYQTSLGEGFWQVNGILMLVTWIAFLVLLIAATRLLWKKGDNIK